MPDDLDSILDRAEAPAEAPSEPAAPAAPVEPAADPFDSGADSFPRPYVENIRNDAAKYRTRAKPFLDAFDGYAEEERDYLLNFARTLKSDPAAAAEMAQQIAQALTGEQIEAADEPLTPESIRAMVAETLNETLAQREQRQAQEAQIASVKTEAKELGYKPDSDDPDDRLAYKALLLAAADRFDGDVKKAHAHREAEKQRIIDAYIASKGQQADQTPTPVPQAGALASGERDISSLDRNERRSALNEYLDALPS